MPSHSSDGQGTAGSAARLVGGWGATAGVCKWGRRSLRLTSAQTHRRGRGRSVPTSLRERPLPAVDKGHGHHRDVIWLRLVAHFIALRLELHPAPASQLFAVVGEPNRKCAGGGAQGKERWEEGEGGSFLCLPSSTLHAKVTPSTWELLEINTQYSLLRK